MATLLDLEMLEVARGIQIASSLLPVNRLQRKTGQEVSDEIGGRYLLRYLLSYQVGRFNQGSQAQHYVTATPYAPDETIPYLALPAPNQPREYVLMLDPKRIPFVWGPQWVRGGPGIQYVLRDGFPRDAIVVPGASGAAWEILVR